jgi:hypothetical protein
VRGRVRRGGTPRAGAPRVKVRHRAWRATAAPGDAMGDCSGVMRQAGTGAGTGRCLAHAVARGGDSGTWHSALIDDGRGIGRGGRPQANTKGGDDDARWAHAIAYVKNPFELERL